MNIRSLCLAALLSIIALSGAQAAELDPDLPGFAQDINKEEYFRQRDLENAERRGYQVGKVLDPQKRIDAINAMDIQEHSRAPEISAYSWTSVGPDPIPNGQTTSVVTAISGRVISIAVHPTDPNKVYVGTANGGLFRSLDGGVTWKALMDSALSLAIGAVAIDPATPTTVWVGTGEGNSNADGFAGVGLYRILNAESASPTLEGPFSSRVAGCGDAGTGSAFLGTSITKIVFDPNNAARMWVGNQTGVAGIAGSVALGGPNGVLGLWLSANAISATPTFSLCFSKNTGGGTPAAAIKDLVVEPGSSSNLLFHMIDRSGVAPNVTGVYRVTNATAGPAGAITSTRTLSLTAGINGQLSINKVGATVTVVSANGTANGNVQKSTDGGATFAAALSTATGFCGGQCFYDIGVAIDPANANRIYVAGSATAASTRIFARSSDGTNFAASENGLHADSHVIAIAPSNPAVIYTGNDGGIFKSADNGATWTSLNVAGFNAAQYTAIATHPINAEFMIGGTQDNGTHYKQANGVWTRTDYGDGGYALIDQGATDTTTVRMYHTYYNSAAGTLLMGYATTNTPATAFEAWGFRGCSGVAGNGISCTATATRFYAPMALGPGTPNTVYFGNDRLYRSANSGTNHTVVSQAPIVSGIAISAIDIADNNDNVRVVGLNNGNVWSTTTGSTTLVNVTGTIPAFIVADIAIDKNNTDIAYVALSGYATAGQNIWKTSNLSNAAPTWTASASGIPSIPTNAIVIDPRNSAILYAGTDIGVYRSINSGATWTSFSSGLPRTPVFDMAFQAATLASGAQTLRIGTHGRGIWEIAIKSAPTATTEVATNVTRTGASLQGVVNDNLFSTTVSFEYGTTISYGSTIAATPGTVNTGTDTNVSAMITGLTANALYHYRVVGTNSVGTTQGSDLTFFTNGVGLQVGSLVIGASKRADFNRVTHVRFGQQFGSTPVVIAQPSDEDADPTALRVINVNQVGFDLLQVEAPGCPACNGSNGTMTVHWLASSPGNFSVLNVGPGGGTVEIRAGTLNTTANQRNTASGFASWPATAWQAVTYAARGQNQPTFASPPIVLSAMQTWTVANEGSNLVASGANSTLVGASQPWATTVVRNITASGFDIAIESSEVDDDDVAPPGITTAETLGYIAIQANASAQIAVFGGGAAIGLSTGTSTATDVCSNVNLSFPTGTTVTLASLRGFSGKQSRNDADGGWLRRCSLTNPSGVNVSMGVRVDEDDDIDAERVHATAEATGNAIFGGDFSTTPITLAQLSTKRFGEQLDVSFVAATEVGHLGYRVWGRESAEADWRPLHTQLLTAQAGDTMTSRAYQIRLAAPEIKEIRIEDVDVLGRSRFNVGVASDSVTGALPIEPKLNWQAIRAANAQAVVRRIVDGSGASAIADVRARGVQRVNLDTLQALGVLNADTELKNLAVVDRGQAVPRFLSCEALAAGCFVEWMGTIKDDLYGRTNSYAIRVDEKLALAVGVSSLFDAVSDERVVTAEITAAPNRAYSFSAPGRDPWYDQRLLSNGAPAELQRNFSLPGRAPGNVELEIALWGGLDYGGIAPDHSVEVLLNGTLLDSKRFDGLTAFDLKLTLPQSLLLENNTLTLRLPGNTGYQADVVLLDGYTVRYPRNTQAVGGELRLGNFAAASSASDLLFGGSFETAAGFAVTGISANGVLWSQRDGKLYRNAVNQDVILDKSVSALELRNTSQIASPSLRPATAALAAITHVDYLIITNPLFEAELAPVVALQQSRGYSVRVIRTDEIYAALNDSEPDPEAIAAVIAQISPRFVLLVGGDSYDYDDNLGLASVSFLPTFYRDADPIVRFAATDLPFVDANHDGVPERAIGRIPARTIEELRRAIDSLVARASQPAVKYFGTSAASASSEHFDLDIKAVQSYLRQGQPQELASIDEFGLSNARAKTIDALSGGSDWINYVGHSSPNRWAFQNLLDTSQLANITRTGVPAIVSQWGCWNNYFVLPDQDTMSHALMLRPNHLAAAVIGSTSLAEDASHLALATRLFDLVEDGVFGDSPMRPINTLGEALMAAKRDLAESAPEHIESNYSITLFGDPAQPLR